MIDFYVLDITHVFCLHYNVDIWCSSFAFAQLGRALHFDQCATYFPLKIIIFNHTL